MALHGGAEPLMFGAHVHALPQTRTHMTVSHTITHALLQARIPFACPNILKCSNTLSFIVKRKRDCKPFKYLHNAVHPTEPSHGTGARTVQHHRVVPLCGQCIAPAEQELAMGMVVASYHVSSDTIHTHA